MKLKALAKLIKSNGDVTLYNDTDNLEQWVKTGNGIYLLTRLPWIEDPFQLLNILDISGKDQEKLAINHKPLTDDYSFRDDYPGERDMYDSSLELKLGSLELLPARTSMGLRFYEKDYLAPLKDIGDDYQIKERMGKGSEPYIAVKQGLCIRAIIVPECLEQTKMATELQQLHEEMMVTMSYLATQPQA